MSNGEKIKNLNSNIKNRTSSLNCSAWASRGKRKLAKVQIVAMKLEGSRQSKFQLCESKDPPCLKGEDQITAPANLGYFRRLRPATALVLWQYPCESLPSRSTHCEHWRGYEGACCWFLVAAKQRAGRSGQWNENVTRSQEMLFKNQVTTRRRQRINNLRDHWYLGRIVVERGIIVWWPY
jgi:hypothetical protein